MFSVSTCFGHWLPILRRYYTNTGLVTIVCSCRCVLVSGYGKPKYHVVARHGWMTCYSERSLRYQASPLNNTNVGACLCGLCRYQCTKFGLASFQPVTNFLQFLLARVWLSGCVWYKHILTSTIFLLWMHERSTIKCMYKYS
jgi:hypothetical protein